MYKMTWGNSVHNNKTELTQTGLFGIEGPNPKATPSKTEALPSDKLGDPTESSSLYAIIFSMMQYLTSMSYV